MPGIAVAGAQWGDEGKGKVVHLLSRRADVAVRYAGGPNAGHTLIVDGRKLVVHHLPSGVVLPGVRCVLGDGMVVDPAALIEEIEGLRARGVKVAENLVLSDRAHVIAVSSLRMRYATLKK